MIKYSLYQKNACSHYVYIDMLVDNISGPKLKLQLPAWRPGRYETGNFAKNIKRVDVFNDKNEVLKYSKITKDLWEVETNNASSIKITYSYYAAELNAGSCYADAEQIYINPVHCCMYVPGRTEEEHHVELRIPEDYKIATSLNTHEKTLLADNYEELVDSPFFASATIQSRDYEVNGIKFYLHFNGECKPDWPKIIKDFEAFTKRLIWFWNDFPYETFHFLMQITPGRFRHGVEHKKNTVIAIGPGYDLNYGALYDDLLGISSHELFHVWNVKTIRPAEMEPYDFTKENYAVTGYVYEGFTTYYGDKLLLSSGVFNEQQYLDTLNERLLKHFHNYGRFNLSVAQSSFETWLDGYVPGAPYRKTNIYDEGCLIAFMLDIKILEATDNQKSLRDVCLLLYERFGKKSIGYTEKDVINLVNEVSAKDFTDFFETYVYSAESYDVPLAECCAHIRVECNKEQSSLLCEHDYGFKVSDSGSFSKITLVAPYSPAWKAGLFTGDEIIAVNSKVVRNNLNQWLDYFKDEEAITITANSNDELKTFSLQKDKKGNTFFYKPILKITEESIKSPAFEAWKNK